MRNLNQELQIKEISEHRKEECIHYDTCLSEASALLWPSFSCKECMNYCADTEHRIISYERAAPPLAWDL